jgi:hypothetical protein
MPLFIVSLPDLPATMRHVVSSSSRLGVVHFADLSVDCENQSGTVTRLSLRNLSI